MPGRPSFSAMTYKGKNGVSGTDWLPLCGTLGNTAAYQTGQAGDSDMAETVRSPKRRYETERITWFRPLAQRHSLLIQRLCRYEKLMSPVPNMTPLKIAYTQCLILCNQRYVCWYKTMRRTQIYIYIGRLLNWFPGLCANEKLFWSKDSEMKTS